jgi:hypothetical protein
MKNNIMLHLYLLTLQEKECLNEFQICFFRKKDPLERIRNLKLIDELNLDKNKVLIMGSAVLVLHGIIDRNDDLDLIVTRDVFNSLSTMAKNKINGIIKDYKFKKVFYRTKNKNVEAAVNFQILGKTTEELLKRAVDVKGYKFMSLRDTFKMYKILNREKDVEKITKLSRIFH